MTRMRDEVSGGSTIGTIAGVGEIDDYTFTARAGERLFYDALGIHAHQLSYVNGVPQTDALDEAITRFAGRDA